MKKTNKLILFCIFLILIIPIVNAEKSLVSNSILLSPFYSDGFNSGVVKQYNLTVNPPDGITSVENAILTFNAYILPTVTYTLKVNNQSCDTSNYTVSTTQASAGVSTLSFDCKNVINKEGKYNVTLSANKNTGAITSTLELTYINNPKGTLNLLGTEYQIGDRVTTFLQLKDEQNLPMNNASCYITIYNPSNASGTHPVFVDSAPMIYDGNPNGLYFYEFTAPNITGVYMASASCSYQTGGAFVYNPDFAETFKPNRTLITANSYLGNEIALNKYDDTLYTDCDSSPALLGVRYCIADYIFNTTVHFSNLSISNISSMSVYYAGENQQNAVMLVQFYNWSEARYRTLTNSLTFTPTGVNAITFITDYLTNILPKDAINSTNKIIKIRLNSSDAQDFHQFDNWLSIKIITTIGTIQTLKGSNEVHVSNYASQILSAINNINLTLTNYTAQLNTIQALIVNQSNQSATQFLNLSNQLAQIQNNINLQYTNLTSLINQLNNTEQLRFLTLLNQTYNISNQMLQYEQNNINRFNNLTSQIIALNNSLSSQINIVNQNILALNNTLNLQINLSQQILNNTNTLINITTENQGLLNQIWAYLQSLGITIFNINNTVNQINTTVNNLLLGTNSTPHANSIFLNESDCISDSNWVLKATVLDQYSNNYAIATCYMNSTQFGNNNPMPYQPPTQTYDFVGLCPQPTNWSFLVDCN